MIARLEKNWHFRVLLTRLRAGSRKGNWPVGDEWLLEDTVWNWTSFINKYTFADGQLLRSAGSLRSGSHTCHIRQVGLKDAALCRAPFPVVQRNSLSTSEPRTAPGRSGGSFGAYVMRGKRSNSSLKGAGTAKKDDVRALLLAWGP